MAHEQLHWLLEGIDIGVVQRHPQRVYGMRGLTALSYVHGVMAKIG